MSFGALFEFTRMRLVLLLRQPEIVFWAFVFPILLSIVLGLAFGSAKPVKSRVVLLDGIGGPTGYTAGTALSAAPDVELERTSDPKYAAQRLRSGAVDLIVVVGERGEHGDRIQLVYDVARPDAELARERAADALQRHAGRADVLALEFAPVEEAGSRYVDWFFPGLLGLAIMSTSIWAVGFALVDARQKKLVRRFLVTPMRRADFLLSHIFARMALLVLEIVALLSFARFALGVPFRGSIAAVCVVCVIGALAFCGIGVLLGSRVRTLEAAAGLINLSMMPMGLASGVFFSYERFSESLQPFIRFLPLTAFNDALRAVILEGQSLVAVAPLVGIQLVWGAAAFLIGLAIFRWQ